MIADARWYNPETVMPPNLGMEIPKRFRIQWQPKHILDLMAYLKTFYGLRELNQKYSPIARIIYFQDFNSFFCKVNNTK